MEDKSQRYDINRRRPRMDTNILNIKCVSVQMVIRNKQHLSNTSSPILEKVKQHRGWVEKKRCL